MFYFGFLYLTLASIDAAMGKWFVSMLGFYSDTAAGWFGYFFYLRKKAGTCFLKVLLQSDSAVQGKSGDERKKRNG